MIVLNKHKHGVPDGAIYIGRGSRWGNPFVIGRDGDRDRVCDLYSQHLKGQIRRGEVSLQDLAALHGKALVCFCSPQRCHGDTLLKAAQWASQKVQLMARQNSNWIEVDGVLRPTRNSSGQLIHSSVDGVVNFWRWFGDSKVVDMNGRPRVHFHGTAAEFDGFDIAKFGECDDGFMGAGFYFTEFADDAAEYAAMSSDRNYGFVSEDEAPGAHVLPVYLSVRNPYRMKPGESGPSDSHVWTNSLAAMGFDGVINHAGTEVVAFSPNQIKSAIGNSGRFDPESTMLTDVDSVVEDERKQMRWA